MSARPLLPHANRFTLTSTPRPIREWFHSAGLADPPLESCELQFDCVRREEMCKTLVSFRASSREVNEFLATSPATERPPPHRRGAPRQGTDEFPRPFARAERQDAEVVREPEFPWWDPDTSGCLRRFAYSTPAHDFVEVLVDDERGTVYVRTLD